MANSGQRRRHHAAQSSDSPALAASGPFTEPQIRWFVFQASTNGLAALGAVVRVGRRIYIDVDAFEQWIAAQDQNCTAAA